MQENRTKKKKIVFFDHDCLLCSRAVQFIIKNNIQQNLYFASLQSTLSKKLLMPYGYNPKNISSLIFLDEDKVYVKSTAALRISNYLKGWYRLFSIFLIIPASIRDIFYHFIAHNRYTLFGKTTQCEMLKEEWKNRFLDSMDN